MAKLVYSRDFLLRFADANHFLPTSTNHDLLQELLSLRRDGKSSVATIATATYRRDSLSTKQHQRGPAHPEPEHTTPPLTRQSEGRSKSRNPRPRPRSMVTPIDLVAAVAATAATPDIEEPGPGPGIFDKSARRSSLSMMENGRLLRAHARITQQNQQLQDENVGLRQEVENMAQKVESMAQKVESMAQEVVRLRRETWVVKQENLMLKKREERENMMTRLRAAAVTTTGVAGFGVR